MLQAVEQQELLQTYMLTTHYQQDYMSLVSYKMKYKLIKDFSGEPVVVFDTETNTSFRIDGDSTNLQAYLKWVSEGNTPLPAENN
jgi:hypothetical protein